MPRHFGEFIQSERSAGVIVIPQHPPVSAAGMICLSSGATRRRPWNRICHPPL
jgi:hypothetical protein